ncbi:MAG: DUF6240 domain-containing protein [Kineothrix sp.]
MNIVFESGRADREIRNSNGPAVRTNAERAAASQGNSRIFTLDIAGTVMDDKAYEGRGKTVEEVMQDAGQMDVAAQKNYMIVMSGTMSDEDFARLQKEGGHPGSTEIETVVTIVDEIKAAMAKGGSHIVGYTDDLDVETLTQITGSPAMAEEMVRRFREHDIPVTRENAEEVCRVCDTAARLDSLSDGVMKYMIRNRMEPTVDNIYLSQHSSTADADRQGRGYYQDDAGYYAKKAEDYNWQQLRPQMEKVIQNADLAVSEETLADARWLVEKGIPLTEESLQSLYELRNLELPETMEQAVSAACAAIADGKKAGNANMADPRSALEKALQYMEDVSSITDEAVDQVMAEGGRLNIRNLKAAQIQLSISVSAASHRVSQSGRLLMEEVRLQMTVEANIRLIRSGFSVDTAELEQLVEALKNAGQQAEQALFGKNPAVESSGLYRNTIAAAEELGSMPAALVGRFAFRGREQITVTSDSFTLQAAYEEGAVLRSAYEKAGESYETLMTAPRADLGDSIKKAFRNVDHILKDMDLEASDANRRAVRILGYNRMEISEENIRAVRITDLTIQRVLDKMTPGSVLEMIREGINPLEMNMEELEAYLGSRDADPGRQLEKYSEYLYKLERNHSVTEQERESYIGIYRLFRQLEKTDGAAIGTLVNQGLEPTVGNLLSAMRSGKKQGMDVTVDGSFGGVTSSYVGKSISEQLVSAVNSRPEIEYYQKQAARIFDSLDGGKMDAVALDQDMSLEQLAEVLQETRSDEAADREYSRQQAGEFRQAVKAEDLVLKELMAFDQPITSDNLLAAGLLMKERGKAARRLFELAEQNGSREAAEEAMEQLQENLTDKESAREAFQRLEQTYTDILEKTVYSQDPKEKLDLREMGNLFRQISLSGRLAREENYEIPVKIGEEVTSVNLRIIHNSREAGRVTVTTESAVYGRLAAQFSMSIGKTEEYSLSGYMICDSREAQGMLESSSESLKKTLESSGIQTAGLNCIYKPELDLTALSGTSWIKEAEPGMENTGTEVSTRKLYEAAKIFIGYMQKGEGLNL